MLVGKKIQHVLNVTVNLVIFHMLSDLPKLSVSGYLFSARGKALVLLLKHHSSLLFQVFVTHLNTFSQRCGVDMERQENMFQFWVVVFQVLLCTVHCIKAFGTSLTLYGLYCHVL